MEEDVELYFNVLFISFTNQKVNSDIGIYSCLIDTLSTVVRHIILQPPASGKYEAVKTAIIAQSSISDAERLQKLMNGFALGDGKPSALLRQM